MTVTVTVTATAAARCSAPHVAKQPTFMQANPTMRFEEKRSETALRSTNRASRLTVGDSKSKERKAPGCYPAYPPTIVEPKPPYRTMQLLLAWMEPVS